MNSNLLNLSITDDIHAMLIINGAVSRMTKPLEVLLAGLSTGADSILQAMTAQEDSSLPLIIVDKVWLSTSVGAGVERLVTLKSASRLELEEWLDIHQGKKPCMMVNGSGRIFAVNESAEELFAGYGMGNLSDFLDQISMTAFLTAASKCLSGEDVKDFSILTSKGQAVRKSQVVSLMKTGLMDELLLIVFSSPSMAMRTLEQDASKFAQCIFSAVPLSALRINEKADVLEMNGYASNLFGDKGQKTGELFNLLDAISPDDRDRVASMHRNRFDSVMSPFQYRAAIKFEENVSRQFEITAILTPSRDSFMLFMVPMNSEDPSEPETMGNRLLTGLLKVLERSDDTEGHTRMVLEFLRVGTGARGAAYISKSRRITVGETSLPSSNTQLTKIRKPQWSEDSEGHCITIPVKQKHDQAVVRVSGISSRRSDPVSRLVIGLAPILAQHLQSTHHLDSIIRLQNCISSFMTLIQGRGRDLHVILSEIGSIVGADYSVIHTVSSKEPLLKQLVSVGTSADPGSLRLEIPSIASWAYTHTELCYVPDTAVDQRFSSIFPSSRSEMAIPLVEGGKTAGTLTVGCTRRDAFDYPTGSFLGVLGTALSLWLFRDNRGIGSERNGSKSEGPQSVPGLEDLLLSLSHHLRAPITTLRGHRDLLATEKLGKVTSEQMESLDEMSSALIDLVEYTERMLNFMKIELGQSNIETSWARPSDLVSSMMPLFTEKAREMGLGIQVELPEEPFTASFDRARLEQVLSNLVTNAIQFNRTDGQVKLEVRMDGSSHWILEVFNTGDGIPQDDLPNVFDRFFVGDPGRGKGGLGIGLTIVKSFTQQMGGTINVRSSQGQGTWFTVRFPLS